MTTISVNKPSGVVLNPASYVNPVVIAAGITISNGSGGDAVSISGAAYVFTVQNNGTISAPGSTAGAGVFLAPGGLVTNEAAGLITAYAAGISISGGAGTVVNDGSIASTGVNATGADNGHVGVDLVSGGSVTNAVSGSIVGVEFGVGISGAAGTVVNYGSITDDLGTSVYLGSGGSVTNADSASIKGYDGVEIVGAGMVFNGGSIAVNGFVAVDLTSGGSLTNAISASIVGGGDGIEINHGAGTVVNYGSIVGTGTAGTGKIGFGLYLRAGGFVTNAAFGAITGATDAVYFTGDPGTVVNNGSIAGVVGIAMRSGGAVTNGPSASITGYSGIEIYGGTAGHAGTVLNAGSIAVTGAKTWAVVLDSAGSVTNVASGTIESPNIAVAINGGIARVAGTVVNYGSIGGAGTAGIGVYLGAGGSMTNEASASITGYSDGVSITGAAGTVLNGGSIAATGTSGHGVALASGGSVTNKATASITGFIGVSISGAAGTVVNDGSIAGTATAGFGVALVSGGSVTNAVSGSITGDYAVVVGGGTGGVVHSVANYGRIGGADIGVWLVSGGAITNAAAASITGVADGVEISGDAGTAVNNGSITGGAGTGGVGVYLKAGGSLTNAASASITGYTGVKISAGSAGAAGTVVNDGSITGTGAFEWGVFLGSAGSVTNAASASITGADDGVYIFGHSAGTVVNDGSITGKIGFGVADIASVMNAGSGSIKGGYWGVELPAGGVLTNAASASITGGRAGVENDIGGATVVNYGSIANTDTIGFGVELVSGGSVINAGSASITSGSIGVQLVDGGTLVNAGTIIGGGGTAVSFIGAGSNLLVLEPGYGFSGLVAGSTSASDTLELASAASAGTLGGLGTQIVNFGSAVFDAGANWSVTGSAAGIAGTITVLGTVQEEAGTFVNSDSVVVDSGILDVVSGTFDNAGSVTVENSGTFFIANAAVLSGTGSVFMKTGSTTQIATPVQTGAGFYFTDPATLILDGPATFKGTIGGLGAGDVIELTGQTITSGSITGTTLTLDLAGGGTQTFTVAPGESGVKFAATPSGSLEVACFTAGTRLLSASGKVPVEALAPGAVLATMSGRLRPVRWIGYRRIEPARHPRPQDVLPVRVAAHAFGPNVPHRDLWVSPDHALFLDGVLIPARHLCNGATIRQEVVEAVEYFHVELERHDILLTEGMPCESYLDTGNRTVFESERDLFVLTQATFAP